MLDSNVKVTDSRTTTISNNSYAANSLHHTVDDSFFVSFQWGSEIGECLMGRKPFFYEYGRSRKVEVIQMVTMLNYVVAELRVIDDAN